MLLRAMKYLIILTLFLASCQKSPAPVISASIYSKLIIQNNYSGYWYNGDNITVTYSYDTIFAKIKRSANFDDYELVTAVNEDVENYGIISAITVQNNIPSNIQIMDGRINLSSNQCFIDMNYISGNTEQFKAVK